MKKITETHYCDICEKEIDNYSNLTVPRLHDEYAFKKWRDILKYTKTTIDPIEVCPKCVQQLACLIELLKNDNLSITTQFDGEGTTINWEVTI